MQPMMTKIAWYISLALLGLVALFALQNIQEAEVTVLVWTFHMPLIIVIMLSFIIGIIVGWVYPFHGPGDRDRGRGA